jgi:phospholipase/carboxylesterase
MEPSRIGPLRVRTVGRGGGPAILLCHGFGAPGDDLVSLARVIDAGRDVRWFFPEAPIALDLGWGMTGRAWWNIDMERLQRLLMSGQARRLAEETPAGLAEARAALEDTIAALERDHGVTRDRLIIGGFSQGAMLTTEVALHAETPFAGLAILSGTLTSADRWAAAARAGASQITALQAHGRRDPLLPFAAAEALRDLLTSAGAEVEWVPHGGEHEIPEAVLDRLGAFARRRFARLDDSAARG